jgi:hypothetical protein
MYRRAHQNVLIRYRNAKVPILGQSRAVALRLSLLL